MDTNAADGNNVNRRNLLRAAGIASFGAAAVIAATTPAHAGPSGSGVNSTEVGVGNNTTTPQEYGAVGDGIADDTEPIQKAIDAQLNRLSKIVYFPPGVYRITKTLVIPDLEDGDAPNYNRIVLSGAGTISSHISEIHVDFDGVGIDLQAPLASVRGMTFTVQSGLKNTIALNIARNATKQNANSDDMDAAIVGCTFVEFYKAVKQVGRGLIFSDNQVAVGDYGLDISWPTQGIAGTGVHLLPYGMRKWLIEGNHFHSVSTAILTTGADAEHFRGAVIANNTLDIGQKLFAGGIINSTFTGNTVEHGNNGAIISITSGGTNLTFSGNILGGADPGGGARPSSAIQFGSGAGSRNVTIVGNSFNWITQSPVRFDGPTSLVTISSNTFDDWNLDKDPRWAAVRIAGDADGVSVIGNAFRNDTSPTLSPVRVTGKLTGSTVIGNVFHDNAGVLDAGTLGDGNYIARPVQGTNQHELLASHDGALIIRATGADGPASDQTYGNFLAASDQSSGAGPGVKGGVRVVPVDADGAAGLEFVASTTDSNAVATMRLDANRLAPVADGAIDVGASDARIGTIFAHDMQLAAVAADDLPDPAKGAIVMVNVARRGLSGARHLRWPFVATGRTWCPDLQLSGSRGRGLNAASQLCCRRGRALGLRRRRTHDS